MRLTALLWQAGSALWPAGTLSSCGNTTVKAFAETQQACMALFVLGSMHAAGTCCAGCARHLLACAREPMHVTLLQGRSGAPGTQRCWQGHRRLTRPVWLDTACTPVLSSPAAQASSKPQHAERALLLPRSPRRCRCWAARSS